MMFPVSFEATASFADLRRVGFGESDIQLGHCIGKNTLLNALEYHRGSEINVFDTDAVLILGKREDIDASDDDGIVFEVSPEGSETVDSVIIREEIDKFLTDILVNPPKKLSPQAVSVLTKLQKNWVHILSVKTIVGILERVVSVPEKFKNIKSDKE